MNHLFLRALRIPAGMKRLLVFLLSIALLAAGTIASAQPASSQYASVVLSESNVTSSSNSTDANPSTYSELEAGTGIIIGIGNYSSHIELQFSDVVQANQTSYIRIETEDNILPSLMGGTIGNLLSGIYGIALVGNQEFSIQVMNGASVVLSGNSTNPSSFSGERLKVVTDANNHMYLAITPSQSYQSIRIANFVGSLVGLGVKKRLKVWDAYYGTPGSATPSKYSSYDASGISLELLNLEGGAHNIERTIDGSASSHSTLSLGVVSNSSSITQRIYFDKASDAADAFAIRIGIDPTLLAITLGQGVNIRTQIGASVITNNNLTSLLTPADVVEIQNGRPVSVYVKPNQPIDRIVVTLNGLLGVTVSQALDVYDVYKPAYAIATSVQPSASGNLECSPNPVIHGGSAVCTATANVGYRFIGWGSDCSGAQLSCTLADVTAARVALANFAPLLEENLTLTEGPQAGQGLHLAVDNTNAWQLAEAQTLATAAIAELPPTGVTLPHGVVRLRLVLGAQGTDATVVLSYPQAFPPGTVYYKYGRTRAKPTPHWYIYPHAQISGNTITLTLTDGDAGDGDLAENSEIDDPGGPAILASSGLASIPTLSQWATFVLACALACFGIAAMRRR